MTLIKNWLISLVRLTHSVKDETLHLQLSNQQQLNTLKQNRILQEQELAAALQKRNAQLAHDLALLKAKHDTELMIYQTRCAQDLKDYKQYLQALEQLKTAIKTSYTGLPEAVAFTIHHHAKQLLNNMWEAENLEEKLLLEMRLIQFMAAVHEDAKSYLANGGDKRLPEQTLKLLQP